MTAYYTVFFVLLSALFVNRSSKNPRWNTYVLLIVGLFLFSAFRDQVGCDWVGYEINYLRGHYLLFEDAVELRNPGHWATISTLNLLGLPYQWLNVVTSLLFFWGLHALARRQPDPLAFLVICFPILIINMPMSAIKQAAAIGLLCLAYCAFIDKRPAKFAILVLLGWTFHDSIMLFLLLTPFVIGKYRRRNFVFAAILAAPGLFMILQSDAALLAETRYVDTDRDAAGAVFRLALLSLTGGFFLLVLARSWQRQFPEDYKIVSLGALMMCVFFSLFFVSTVIGDRFGYYLIPIQAMIFARIPYLKLGSVKPVYSILPILAISLVFIVWTQLSTHFNNCYIPYQSWLV